MGKCVKSPTFPLIHRRVVVGKCVKSTTFPLIHDEQSSRGGTVVNSTSFPSDERARW